MTGEKLNQNPDSVGGSRTLYDANYSEIFWKNLVAGAARGLGQFFFNILLVLVVGGLFFNYVWPMIEPLLASFTTLTEQIEGLQGINNNLPVFFGR